MWETGDAASSRVDYDSYSVEDDGYSEDLELVTIHEVELTSLAADTTYNYTVTSVDSASASVSTVLSPSTFRTAPAAPRDFRFVAYGDTRTEIDAHAAVIQGIIDTPAPDPEFVLHVGDLVSDGGDSGDWGPEFFAPAHDLMVDTPMLPVLGNHEYNLEGEVPQQYLNLFSLPDNGSTSPPDQSDNSEYWYAFTYGNVRLIGLDTNQPYSPESEQGIWLNSEFRSDEYDAATWHIVYFHHPPYSTGGHGSDTTVRSELVPLFQLPELHRADPVGRRQRGHREPGVRHPRG
jgi:hypothetical protein